MTIHNGNFLYPPRPKHKVSVMTLYKYTGDTYFAQVKLNGSCGVLILNKDNHQLLNRHGNTLTLCRPLEFDKLYRGKETMVLIGEYLNKNKKGEDGESFNHKFVIFDIVAYNGKSLEGTTLQSRVDLLEKLYPSQEQRVTEQGIESHQYIYQTDVKDVYKVCNFRNTFTDLFMEITKIDVYEGLVLKRRNAKLEGCYHQNCNQSWQLKVRKETKNYKF